MKKQLISTSAIALGVAMAAPAAAQEWNMVWGGFSTAYVGVSDVDVDPGGLGGAPSQDRDGVDVFINREIHFSPNVTLDNGINVGFNIQYEGDNTGGAIVDESYVTIQSDTLGRVVLGNENSAGYLSMTAAPTVTSLFINSPSTSAFIPRTGSGGFRQAQISAFTEVIGNNDVPRITYYTPSFAGLTVGVSYAATANVGLNVPGSGVAAPFLGAVGNNAGASFAPDRDALDIEDIFDIGASYSQSFGAVDVTLGARYGMADSNVPGIDDPETWGIGATFGYQGFTIGGHYVENDNGLAGDVGDQKSWSLGVTYDLAGPWSFEALTMQGELDLGPGFSDNDYEAYRIGAARKLGPGVNWQIFYIHSETNNAAVAGNPEVDGDLIATAIGLSF